MASISLVDESLDLRAVTSPKDFSPLALRTPVLVRRNDGVACRVAGAASRWPAR